jgi:hypothetical protein
MDAQLLISHIRAIGVTGVRERVPGRRGEQRFVRVITVRYADDSVYEIRLSANDAAALEFSHGDPPAP